MRDSCSPYFVLHLAHGVAHGWAQPPLLVIRPSRTPYHLPGDACTSQVIWLLFYNMWALPLRTNGEWSTVEGKVIITQWQIVPLRYDHFAFYRTPLAISTAGHGPHIKQAN